MKNLNEKYSAAGQETQPIDAMRKNYATLQNFLGALSPEDQKTFRLKADKKLDEGKEELRKLAAKLQELQNKQQGLLAKTTQEKTTQAEQHKIFPELIKVMEQIEELSGKIQAKKGIIALWGLEID